jgi:prepilin-type N-terminal cleavage/methylation domain-containing protein
VQARAGSPFCGVLDALGPPCLTANVRRRDSRHAALSKLTLKTHFNAAKGFTLLELLLVVAVMAILAALLLPALGRAKAKAQRSGCMNNLRQINLGVRMYADDSSDAFPPPPPGHNGPPDAFTAYTKRMRNHLGMTGASSERAALFACPADTFYYDYNYRVSEGLHLQSHYNCSSYAFNGGNFPMGQPPVRRWPGIAGRKLSSIKEPVKTVLVSEFAALGPWSWHQPAGATGHYNNAQNMVSYVDGHVRFIKMYWDATTGTGHIETWQYDPPPGYDYKWSGD